MKKPQLENRHSPAPFLAYIIGFVLSIITTLAAYFITVKRLWNADALIYIILSLAVVQLIVQIVFFLHIGRGSRWKAISFYFMLFVVLIIVIGTIWIMHNLNYNMMDMSPAEMKEYMHANEGI